MSAVRKGKKSYKFFIRRHHSFFLMLTCPTLVIGFGTFSIKTVGPRGITLLYWPEIRTGWMDSFCLALLPRPRRCSQGSRVIKHPWLMAWQGIEYYFCSYVCLWGHLSTMAMYSCSLLQPIWQYAIIQTGIEEDLGYQDNISLLQKWIRRKQLHTLLARYLKSSEQVIRPYLQSDFLCWSRQCVTTLDSCIR